MPFGAELTQAGVRFSLWAPSARRMELMLTMDGAEQALPMEALPAGWFHIVTADAQAGSLYRFRIDGDPSICRSCIALQSADARARRRSGPVRL